MGLREIKRERTRQRIAEVALELFTRGGFEQVTVEQVAAAAEVGPSTVYRHFASKDGLVLEFVNASLRRALGEIRGRSELDVPTCLQMVLQLVLDDLVRDRRRARTVFVLARKAPSVQSHLRRLIWRFQSDLTEEVAERLSDSDLPNDTFAAALIAGAIVNVLETVARFWTDDPLGTRAADLAGRALSLLLDGGLPLPEADFLEAD